MVRRAAHSKARTAGAFRVRKASRRDLTTLVHHRTDMVRAMGGRSKQEIEDHERAYRAWLRPRLRRGGVVGFLAYDPAGHALGSGCVFFRPDHPRAGIRETRVPYVLSMFTEPQARRRGIATAIIRRTIALARARGYQRMVLHAAPLGQSVYEKLGFEPSREMRLYLDPALARQASQRQRVAARQARADRRG